MSSIETESEAELEREYDVRKLRADFDDLIVAWSERSSAYRALVECRPDVSYGNGPRDRLDIFLCGQSDAPVLFYLHGGYWQRGDKSIYSFVAAPFVDRGANVVIANYDLCPSGTIGSITSQVRAAVVWLWRNADRNGLSRDRISVSGHSAGGHLTAMCLATDWTALGDDLPIDIVKSGIPISGLYDLDPLRQTSINDAMGMDEASAQDCSPMLLKPVTDAPILATLGGRETRQFHWQTDRFVETWKTHGAPIEQYAEPGVDHFDVVNRLAESDSGIFQAAWNCLS